ncbi:MAG: DNA/RNA non-specific endonuclease [Marinospirillum sp.]|nr:DNA/RNA non-specific endonuclease [Marinospirillum sp.]
MKLKQALRLKKILRLPRWLLVFVLLGGGFVYWQEVQQREYHAYAGLPQVQDWKDWQNWHRVLRNEGFMMGYSDWRLNPLWVIYRLDNRPTSSIGPRPTRFDADWRTLPFWQVTHDNYTRSGYDRGHLAPNYAIAQIHGREAQLKTFLMTNISPQTPELNRQVWQRIEQSAMDHFVQIKGELWVITGPVFGDRKNRLSSDPRVHIPEAFYKIFVAPPRDGRPLKVLAFLVPQQVNGREPLDQFLVSVREVEQQTGLNFLHRLPQELQDELETVIQPEPWQLGVVNRRMGRF